MAYQVPRDKVVYNFRYFLPHAPVWGSEELCNQRLQELLEFCNQAGIDAVQFYVNTLPGTYYMPAHSAQEQAVWATWMRDVVAPAVRGIGVSYQLNLQQLLGAASYNVDMRDEYDWEFLVSDKGIETYGCACPIGPRFRRTMGEMLGLWASTKPDVIWIDDDFRMHNHGHPSNGLDYYCYCDHHLAEFAKQEGRVYTREELLAEALKPTEPSELRLRWMDFLGETMVESAAWVREQIQNVSPETRLALMTSCPEIHSAEGRDWKPILEALSGEYAPLTRPMGGIYTGTTVPVKAFACSYDCMHQSIQMLDNELGHGVVDCAPEIENTRFTTWAKSVSATRYMMTVSALLGCGHITFSVNDLDGSPISEEPSTVGIFRDSRAFLQAITDLDMRNWKAQGVSLLTDPRGGRKQQLSPGATYSQLADGRDWPWLLLEMGIPAKYVTSAQAAKDADVVALDRYSAWLPTDDELKSILSGAVLLDGGGADVVQSRGFGEHIGADVGDFRNYGILAEHYQGGVLPGMDEIRVPHRGFAWYEIEANGAKVASEFIDGKNRRHPGSLVHENALVGRVSIYASVGDFASGTFGSHARHRWLRALLRWLSRGSFPALPIIPHHCLTVVRSRDSETIIALANLGTDTLTSVGFSLPGDMAVGNVQALNESGDWTDARAEVAGDPDAARLRVPCSLNAFEFVVLRMGV